MVYWYSTVPVLCCEVGQQSFAIINKRKVRFITILPMAAEELRRGAIKTLRTRFDTLAKKHSIPVSKEQ